MTHQMSDVIGNLQLVMWRDEQKKREENKPENVVEMKKEVRK